MHRVPLLLVCASIFLARPLSAQTTGDTARVTFHPAEWGVEFIPGRDATTIGIIRFATPTRAWVLDGSASLDWITLPGGGAFGKDASGHAMGVSALFGPRWYRAEGAQVVGFGGWGISGSLNRSQAPGSSDRYEAWSAGAYGELGMQYLFTPHFSLGCRGTLMASRIDSRSITAAGNTTELGYHLGLGALQVTGTIFF